MSDKHKFGNEQNDRTQNQYEQSKEHLLSLIQKLDRMKESLLKIIAQLDQENPDSSDHTHKNEN